MDSDERSGGSLPRFSGIESNRAQMNTSVSERWGLRDRALPHCGNCTRPSVIPQKLHLIAGYWQRRCDRSQNIFKNCENEVTSPATWRLAVRESRATIIPYAREVQLRISSCCYASPYSGNTLMVSISPGMNDGLLDHVKHDLIRLCSRNTWQEALGIQQVMAKLAEAYKAQCEATPTACGSFH